MWTFHPDLLSANVPRYTSYPTALEFRTDVAENAFLDALDNVAPETPISLYVHIPYCQQICWYCGCNTGAASKEKRLTSYLAALESEIVQVATQLNGRGKVSQISFGGGSPNAIAPVEFVRLTDRLMTMFNTDNPRISVEIDPRIFSSGWAATLARCGVSRVSLGVQSFSPEIQQAIGRTQPLQMIEDCIWSLRDAGIQGINFDLMYGLPNQRDDELFATLETAAGLAPDRIALFGYAHMPQIFPRQRRINGDDLPGAAQRFAMASLGYDYLTKCGYDAIGFDHFALAGDSMAIAAKAGTLRRNFQGFTDDSSDVMIGIGASAISYFPEYIIQNEKNVGDYRSRASALEVCAARGVRRNVDDRVRAKLIEKLLCFGNSGPLPDDIRAKVACDLTPFSDRGLAKLENDCIVIDAEGVAYARAIASLLDGYRQHMTSNFSPAV